MYYSCSQIWLSSGINIGEVLSLMCKELLLCIVLSYTICKFYEPFATVSRRRRQPLCPYFFTRTLYKMYAPPSVPFDILNYLKFICVVRLFIKKKIDKIYIKIMFKKESYCKRWRPNQKTTSIVLIIIIYLRPGHARCEVLNKSLISSINTNIIYIER